MADIADKVAFLAYYVESVARIALAIPDDHLARVYGRSLFLGVDSFLKLAPRLKNELKKSSVLTLQQADDISEKIKKLTSDYEAYYDTIRDKFAAHQQEVDLVLLIESWNEIDETTIRLFADAVSDIWTALLTQGAIATAPRPVYLDDDSVLDQFAVLTVDRAAVQMGLDRVASTRINTPTMIPLNLFQEKAQRIITAFDTFRLLVESGLENITVNWLLPEKATIDLLIVDACSILDNIFDDRPATKVVAAEDSLLKIWTEKGVRGTHILASFPREAAFEQQLRTIRNKVSAHLDDVEPLPDLISLLEKFPLQTFSVYMNKLWVCFQDACYEDIRTKIFLIHGQVLRGAVSVENNSGVKPFRNAKSG